MHNTDLKAGFGAVYLPYALERNHVLNRGDGQGVQSPGDRLFQASEPV